MDLRLHNSEFEALSGKTGPIVGSSILHFAELSSTMDECWRQVAAGAPEGLVVIADGQTAGRGRHGRAWVSKPGEDLLFSAVLYPRPLITYQLVMAASLAIVGASQELTGVLPSLKWPNDVRVDGKKLCGILADTRQTGDRIASVLGIGLNVNLDPASIPLTVATPTSLCALKGQPVSRVESLRVVLRQLDSFYCRAVRGESLIDEWATKLETIGKEVAVSLGSPSSPGNIVRGIAEGVDELGRLLVRDETGRLWPMASGEVTLRAPA